MTLMLRRRDSRTRSLRVARVLSAALVAGASVGCGGRPTTPPDRATPPTTALGGLEIPASAPAIRGTVTRVVAGDSVAPAASPGDPNAPVSCPPSCAPAGRPRRAILVEEVPGPITSGGDKSLVTVLAGARVLRRTGGGVGAAGFGELRVGQRVSAWFDGPVAESYPSQARARVVVIEP